MALIKTEALVLKTTPFQESSLIAKLFSKEQGKVSVIAKGARRLKSSLRGYLEPLSYIEAIYYYKSTREIQILAKVDLIQAFCGNNADLKCNVFSTAVLELIDRTVYDHQHDEEIFAAAVRALKAMDQEDVQYQPRFIGFLLILAGVLGYQLETGYCSQCNRPMHGAYFNSATGQLVCERCGGYLRSANKLSATDLDLLKHLQQPKAKGGFEKYIHSDTDYNRLIRLLINYLAYHTGSSLNLKSLAVLAEIEGQEK
jgi:DNA repair protein RecO (recombination protein O)